MSGVRYRAELGVAAKELIRRSAESRRLLIEREIFVAVRYGLSARDASELSGKCEEHLASWRALLERWRGCVELTLKIGSGSELLRPERKSMATGAEYLRELQRMRQARTVPAEFGAALEAEMIPLSLASRWIRREEGMHELALMIRRTELERARGAGAMLAERFPRIPFLLSGPWPLEVFADES